MKKIISALALGAMTVGFAAADVSIGLNYRNGVEVFKYVNKGTEGRATDEYGNVYIDSGYDKAGATYDFFSLKGWNGGKDNLSLKASGDVFGFSATIQPTIGSNADVFHIMTVDMELGNFYAKAGWTGDGLMNFRLARRSSLALRSPALRASVPTTREALVREETSLPMRATRSCSTTRQT